MFRVESTFSKTMKASRRLGCAFVVEPLRAVRAALHEHESKGEVFDEERFKARLASYLKSVEAATSE